MYKNTRNLSSSSSFSSSSSSSSFVLSFFRKFSVHTPLSVDHFVLFGRDDVQVLAKLRTELEAANKPDKAPLVMLDNTVGYVAVCCLLCCFCDCVCEAWQ